MRVWVSVYSGILYMSLRIINPVNQLQGAKSHSRPMLPKQRPSRDFVVVRTTSPDVGSVESRLEHLGRVAKLPVKIDGESAFVVQLKGSDNTVERELCELQNSAEFSVEPLLVDDSGNEHIPTGSISVRFRKSLSQAELERFAKHYDLSVRERNEFVPEQVVLQPIGPPERRLQDVLEQISPLHNVRAAWPNTISQYQRAY